MLSSAWATVWLFLYLILSAVPFTYKNFPVLSLCIILSLIWSANLTSAVNKSCQSYTPSCSSVEALICSLNSIIGVVLALLNTVHSSISLTTSILTFEPSANFKKSASSAGLYQPFSTCWSGGNWKFLITPFTLNVITNVSGS